MKKLNLSFVSLSKNQKCSLVSIVLVTLITVLAYLYVYELIYVISEEDILNNLIPVDVSSVSNTCPFVHAHKSNSLLPNCLVSKEFTNDANLLAKTLEISPGGEWHPNHCTSKFLVAVIVPYRAREDHLNVFLHNIHPFIQKQNIHYKLYVIEQSDRKEFNRGKLFNIGFIEALKDKSFPCFIFHDVDLLPQNVKNIYACTKTPRHMSAAIDKFGYSLPYYRNFGGVVSILAEQFRLVDGFSNDFYGWGGEDDDFYNRMRIFLLRPVRFDYSISQYCSLPHEPAKPSEKRFDIMGLPLTYDGRLNSTNYVVIRRSNEPLCTKIVVDL